MHDHESTTCFATALQVLESEGLQKYVDPRYLQRELAEATGLSQAEMDVAAHQLMLQRQNNGVSSHHRTSPTSSYPPPNVQSTSPQHRRPYDGSLR